MEEDEQLVELTELRVVGLVGFPGNDIWLQGVKINRDSYPERLGRLL